VIARKQEVDGTFSGAMLYSLSAARQEDFTGFMDCRDFGLDWENSGPEVCVIARVQTFSLTSEPSFLRKYAVVRLVFIRNFRKTLAACQLDAAGTEDAVLARKGKNRKLPHRLQHVLCDGH